MDFINTCFETTSSFRPLALYSHLLPTLVAGFLGYIIFKYAENRTTARLFLLTITLLSLWLISDLVAWHSNDYYLVAAFWSTLDYLSILTLLVYLVFFVNQITQSKRYLNVVSFAICIAAIIPFLITVSGNAVTTFDETNCEMANNEFLSSYKLVSDTFVIFTILVLGLFKVFFDFYNKKRNQRLVLTLASVIFLTIFASSDFVATYTSIYEINLYALFALPIFLVILTYNIFEQGTLRLKIDNFLLAKFLFIIFVLVAVFNLVLADDGYEFGITLVSTLVTFGFGLLLLRSARQEVTQRKEIEQLAKNLERANVRLKELDKQKSEFVSIASHQLRSPLTAIRGYASMLADGSYGQITAKMAEPISRIQDASRLMAESIEDFLNVSRIEAGNMKYELSDFNLRDRTERIVDDLRPEGFKKGLLLLFKQDLSGTGVVHADVGKTEQILHNLINNALKYTTKGTITVFLHDDPKKKLLTVDVLDTGIGMSEETIMSLFEKFTRAKNANSVNIKGTGLGLYVAREMARKMGGDITAHSEGEGKGSRFTFTIPIVL